MSFRREGRAYKILRYLLIFGAAQQDAVGTVQGSAGSSYLLVVVDRGTGSLYRSGLLMS